MGFGTINASEMPADKKVTVLLALATALLYEKGQETVEKKLLKQLAVERHNERVHHGAFMSCTDPICTSVLNALTERTCLESKFLISDLENLKKYKLHFGSPLVGTIRAWLEEENIIQVG